MDDPILNRDIGFLCKKYFSGEAYFDIAANFPALIYIFVNGIKSGEAEIGDLIDDKYFLMAQFLKMLRLYHIKEVFDAFRRLFDQLSEVFFMKRYIFQNLESWFVTIVKFVLCVHYFACGWVLIFEFKQRNGYVAVPNFTDPDSSLSTYVESLYLITTTISTVGYGDFKGFYDTDGSWAAEMSYLYFVTLFGLILFSTVTNEIFNYKSMLTVDKIVSKTCFEMEDYLYAVSRTIKDKSMTKEMVDECIEQMEQTIKHSTRYYFNEN